MKKYSIKTTDGNRFDFKSDEDIFNPIEAVQNNARFITFTIDDVTRTFNVDQIVSISEKEPDR